MTTVSMKTQYGDIIIELNDTIAPITVKNFIGYCQSQFYEDTLFHRVIQNFMIQGGGFLPGLVEKAPTRPAIQNESFNGLSNTKGTIAMARTSQPHSASTQFFINTVDNTFLDGIAPNRWGYAVFGAVIEGLSVVEQIASVATHTQGPHQAVPRNEVRIQKVSILH